MADAKKDAHGGGGSGLVEKAVPWVVLGVILIGALRWAGAPTVVINGESARPIGTVQVPQAPARSSVVQAAPGLPQGKSWTNQGQNSQCAGRPAFTKFACVHPATGQQTTCYCD